MIVANKEASIEKANEISHKLLSVITEESKDFKCEDDPAEQIYLGCHVIGSLMAKICLSLKNYGDIYGIPSLTTESISEWITTISDEHIKANMEMMK